MTAFGLSNITLCIRMKISGIPPATPASLSVVWDDNSAIEDGYRVKWEPTAGGVQLSQDLPPDAEAITISGLVFNTSYDVEVLAFNGGGESSTLGPVALFTPPPLPATTCTATATGATTATIGWTLPGTLPLTGWRVERSPAGANTWTTAGTVAAAVATFAATGLTASTAYDWRVLGYNSNAAVSQADSVTAPSNTATCTTSAPAAFTAKTAVVSSGNYARRTTALTGVADGRAFTISVWVKFTAGNGTDQRIFDISNGSSFKLGLSRLASNVFQIHAYSGGGTELLRATTTTAITTASGWTHVYVAIDALSAATNHKFYVNGVNEYTGAVLVNTADIDMAPSTPKLTLGFSGSDSLPATAELAELWFNDAYLDNLAAFRASGVPVDLGATGSTPLGSAPAFYLSRNGDGNAWATDSSGNGNTLTVTGTLGTGTPP